jgi:antitoxin component YwqK of YwqJK toxin-antitoxin module
MSSNQCIALTALNVQCTRRAITEGYCTQHYNLLMTENKNKENIQIDLPAVLTNHILSDYIQYDELINLQQNIQNLHIDPSRIQIIEYDEPIINISDEIKDFGKIIIHHIIQTKIDGVLRKKEIFLLTNNSKLAEYNYNSDEKLNGFSYEWYNNGNIEYKYEYMNGLKQGFQYQWYNNGKLESQTTYVNDNKNGQDYAWYPNEEIKHFYNYKNNKKEGDCYDFKYINSNDGIVYKYFVKNRLKKYQVIVGTEADILRDKYTKIMSEIADTVNKDKKFL